MTAAFAGAPARLLEGRRGLLAGLLALLALLTYLPGFAGLPPTDRDEARFTQASRQMLETGDLVDIRFQAEPRYKKPIGIYWLQAAAVRLAGQPLDRIWPYRLPSLLAAIIALCLVLRLGEQLFGSSVLGAPAGRQIGLMAALLLGASLLLGVEARLAKTDATLLAATLAAFEALAAVHAGRAGRWTWLQFWLAISIGILIKGPVLPLFALASAACLAAVERRLAWLAALRPLAGLGLTVVLVAPWLIAIGLESHGSFFSASLGHDFGAKLVGGEESHGQPPGFYLAAIAVTFWPGGLLAAAALPGVWRRRREPAIRFLLAWLLPSWILLEVIPTKLPHYVLPLYPALALLTAAVVADRARPLAAGWPRWLVGAGIALWLAVGLGLPLGLGLLRWRLGGGFDPFAAVTALAVGAAMVAALAFFARDRRAEGLAALYAAGLALQAGGFGLLLPRLDQAWLARQAARLVAATSPCAQPTVSAVGYQEPSLVFLLGTATRLVDAPTAAHDLLDGRGKTCRLALIPAEAEAAFRAALAGAAPKPLGQAAGVNYSNGHREKLTLYALP